MNKYFIYTAAVIIPLAVSARSVAQTSAAPAGSMAHSTMAPGTMSPGAMAPGTMAPGAMAPAGSMTGPSAANSAAKLTATDKKFVTKAAQGGMFEVQAAQLAQQKGQSDAVKQFAQAMIDDHTPNNAQLMKLAGTKGLTPPADLDAMQQKMLAKLQGMDGKKFDTAYLKGQVVSHKAVLKAFEDESKNGSDSDLKAFADSTIPTVQKHITMAQTGKTGTM